MGCVRYLGIMLGVCLLAGQAQALTSTYIFRGKVDECREDAGAGFSYMRCRFDLRFDIDSASFGATVNPLAHLRVFAGKQMLASAVFRHYPLYDSEGLPYCNDFCTRATTTRAFLARVAERFPQLSLHTHDEHGTTKEAEARLRDAGYTGREAKARRDSWSALVILEDWLSAGEP